MLPPSRLRLKKIQIMLLFALAVLPIACGGGGGGGGGGTNTSATGSTGGLSRVRVEAVLTSNPNRPIDPRHILPGEQVQFQLVGYTSAGARTVLAATFSTDDAAGQSGALGADGMFTAAAVSAQEYRVTAQGSGFTRTSNYRVVPSRAIVTGLVLDSNAAPGDAIVVWFLDGSGNLLETTQTTFDGFFRASVPASAIKINLNPSSLPPNRYFQSFTYSTKRYTTLDPNACSPAISLTQGSTTTLSTIRVDARLGPGGTLNTPPPPPDGC